VFVWFVQTSMSSAELARVQSFGSHETILSWFINCLYSWNQF